MCTSVLGFVLRREMKIDIHITSEHHIDYYECHIKRHDRSEHVIPFTSLMLIPFLYCI